MIARRHHRQRVRSLLRQFPVVAILGARQVGKTTLARQLAATHRGPVTVFDLGSAAPDFLRQTSETLAGRIAFYELGGFGFDEIGARAWPRLWLRGSFPRAFLARTDTESLVWRRELIRTYLERDVPLLGLRLPATTLRRFWTMLAHYHGQVWNSSEFARAFGVAHTTVQRYLDVLAGTFMVRQLPAWHENLAKRQVRAPKRTSTPALTRSMLTALDDLRLAHLHVVHAGERSFPLHERVRAASVRDLRTELQSLRSL
jgi:predicted AAA+ superfamily ATPase